MLPVRINAFNLRVKAFGLHGRLWGERGMLGRGSLTESKYLTIYPNILSFPHFDPLNYK